MNHNYPRNKLDTSIPYSFWTSLDQRDHFHKKWDESLLVQPRIIVFQVLVKPLVL